MKSCNGCRVVLFILLGFGLLGVSERDHVWLSFVLSGCGEEAVMGCFGECKNGEGDVDGEGEFLLSCIVLC